MEGVEKPSWGDKRAVLLLQNRNDEFIHLLQQSYSGKKSNQSRQVEYADAVTKNL